MARGADPLFVAASLDYKAGSPADYKVDLAMAFRALFQKPIRDAPSRFELMAAGLTSIFIGYHYSPTSFWP